MGKKIAVKSFRIMNQDMTRCSYICYTVLSLPSTTYLFPSIRHLRHKIPSTVTPTIQSIYAVGVGVALAPKHPQTLSTFSRHTSSPSPVLKHFFANTSTSLKVPVGDAAYWLHTLLALLAWPLNAARQASLVQLWAVEVGLTFATWLVKVDDLVVAPLFALLLLLVVVLVMALEVEVMEEVVEDLVVLVFEDLTEDVDKEEEDDGLTDVDIVDLPFPFDFVELVAVTVESPDDRDVLVLVDEATLLDVVVLEEVVLPGLPALAD